MERSALWRERDVALIFGAGVVNDIGDWMLEIALPVYVYLETGSGLKTAAVYVIELLVGVVLGPIGGSLADRWPLRRTLLGTNVAQAVGLLPLLAVQPGRIWPVYLVTVIQGVIRQLNDPASFALLPRLVDDARLVELNSLLASGWAFSRLVGSPLGGAVVAVGGIKTVLVADALTFVVAAIAITRISDRAEVLAAGGTAEEESTDTSVRAGIRVVRSLPPVAALVLVRGLAAIAFSAFPVIFIVFVADYLDGGGTEIGLIRGTSAFGGMVAAVVVGRVAKRFHPAQVMVVGYLSFFVIGLGFVNAVAVTTTFWVFLVLFGLTGFPNVTASIGTTSTAQLLCPPAVRGRLAGLMGAAGSIGAGIGSIGAGLLLEVFSARVLFNAQTTTLGVAGVVGYLLVLRPVRADTPAATP
ncbi:MAG: MFS transporter [Ilumatobacteraceae bacterium]